VVRWQDSRGEYRSLTLSKSIKLTRDTNLKLLAKKIDIDLTEILLLYELADTNIDFYLLIRPWINYDDFNMDKAGLTSVFDEQIEKELSSGINESYPEKKNSTGKALKIKTYDYENVFMNNYGESIFDKIII